MLPAENPELRFSIVVPTYDRPRELAGCLEALGKLDYPAQRFEVIVVDDGGRARLDEVIESFSGRLRVRHLRKPNGGPGSARNAGAAAARGRFLAFTDDDCRPRSDWLSRLEERLEAGPDRLVGGHSVNRLEANLYSEASQLVLDLVYDFYNGEGETLFFASQNLAVPRATFQALAGFDERFLTAEDREFCDRWRHAGHELVTAEDAVVEHGHALSLRSFCRLHFAYGRGADRYHRVRAERGSGRLRDDLRFHLRLPRLLWRRLDGLPPWRSASLLCLLVVWQAANAAGFLRERLPLRGAAP